MEDQIKEHLLKYLNNKLTKNDLIYSLHQSNIKIADFNSYVLNILAQNEQHRTIRLITKPKARNVIHTIKLLDKNFIDSVRNQRVEQQSANNFDKGFTTAEGMFKRSTASLKEKLAADKVLSAFFAVHKNDPFDILDIKFRLKRTAIEYGLEIQDNNVAGVLYEGMSFLIKKVISAAISDDGSVDETELKKILLEMFPILRCITEIYDGQV